jgi:uncharacterized repeat protein (TIGR04138 family)
VPRGSECRGGVPVVSEQLSPNWKAIRQRAGLYPHEAFQFVQDGLRHTSEMVHGESAVKETAHGPVGPERHVSGAQLCLGLRDFAIQKYGMLARTVLERWGIRRTDDFGRIVFAMIEGGMLRKSDDDAEADFHAVFEFDEAFSASSVM